VPLRSTRRSPKGYAHAGRGQPGERVAGWAPISPCHPGRLLQIGVAGGQRRPMAWSASPPPVASDRRVRGELTGLAADSQLSENHEWITVWLRLGPVV